MSKKKIVVKGLALLACILMLAPFTALAQELYESNADFNYDDVADVYDVLTFLEGFTINQFNTPFAAENQCGGDFNYAGDVNLILALVILDFLDLKNTDLTSAACYDYCENNYESQLNQLWCRFICGRCERENVEPCLTPARNPNRPDVTRCKCGEECCSMGTKCCGREIGEPKCCPRRDCCGGIRCCEPEQECCLNAECCEDCCGGIDCCGPEQICQNKKCVCPSGGKKCLNECCNESEVCCGDQCCPPDMCNNGKCECPEGRIICNGVCCPLGKHISCDALTGEC